jgi:hypothetical protein
MSLLGGVPKTVSPSPIVLQRHWFEYGYLSSSAVIFLTLQSPQKVTHQHDSLVQSAVCCHPQQRMIVAKNHFGYWLTLSVTTKHWLSDAQRQGNFVTDPMRRRAHLGNQGIAPLYPGNIPSKNIKRVNHHFQFQHIFTCQNGRRYLVLVSNQSRHDRFINRLVLATAGNRTRKVNIHASRRSPLENKAGWLHFSIFPTVKWNQVKQMVIQQAARQQPDRAYPEHLIPYMAQNLHT